MPSALDAFIADLTNSNAGNSSVNTNESERDGNVDDVLLRFDQSALSIAGGTTLTNLSPTTAINDLGAGRLTPVAILWLVIAGIVAWFLLKRF
jgi:hypothetical protein